VGAATVRSVPTSECAPSVVSVAVPILVPFSGRPPVTAVTKARR